MNKANPQFNFLYDYITNILSTCGYDNLSEDSKKEYLPQFVAHAESRIGAALLPKLNESAAKKMVKMIEEEKSTPEEWQDFWKESVPDYEDILKSTLNEFAEELKQIFVDIKK